MLGQYYFNNYLLTVYLIIKRINKKKNLFQLSELNEGGKFNVELVC